MSKVSRVTCCKGRDLINHCKQIQKPNDLIVEYFPVNEFKQLHPDQELDKDWASTKTSWVCRIKFNEQVFTICHRSKRSSFINCAKKATASLKRCLI